MEPGTWSGDWVSARLGVRVRTTDAPLGVPLADLVGLAVRRNPRRAHLLVSTVLGKHVPTDPHLVLGSGLLLGRLVARVLQPGPVTGDDVEGGRLLAAALAGEHGASVALVAHARADVGPAPAGTLVLGFAETATALGHAVAEALGATTLHSTRRAVPGVTPVGGFEESHSHATSHLLLPEDPRLLTHDAPVVLVDDELSTGATALNTIAALHAIHPREHYVIAALVDLRDADDRAATDAAAHRLGARIDLVALAAGRVDLPADVLAAGQRLVAATEALPPAPVRAGGGAAPTRISVPPAPGLRDGGRHGFGPEHAAALGARLADVATDLLDREPGARASSVHVLGFEELMHAPLLLAVELAGRLTTAVTFSTTTRSPVLPVDDPGYAIRSRLAFAAHDGPSDGPGERYAYNLGRAERFGTVVLVVDSHGDTADLDGPHGLLAALDRVTDRVVVVTVPSYQPLPAHPTPGATP